MATLNWIGGTGVQSWGNAANWDTATVPVTGDSVNILQGNSDIQTGLANAAVLLANLVIAGSFSGTIASATLFNPLQIGATKWIVNCASGNISLDFGSSTYTGVAIGTGNPAVSGLEALRIRGGSAASKLYVAGANTVGLATDAAGVTATLNEWDLQAGTLNVAAGVTWVSGYQGGSSTANVYSGGTLIAQSGSQATLNTFGTGPIATISATANATLSHRPAAGADAVGTLNAGPNCTVDFSTDPRPLTITNPINAAIGCTVKAFDPQQILMHAGGPVQVRTQQCGLQDISLQFGAPVLATIAPG